MSPPGFLLPCHGAPRPNNPTVEDNCREQAIALRTEIVKSGRPGSYGGLFRPPLVQHAWSVPRSLFLPSVFGCLEHPRRHFRGGTPPLSRETRLAERAPRLITVAIRSFTPVVPTCPRG